MPFKYVRKTGRGSWSPEDMSKAVMACRRGEMSIRLAAKTYNVPKSTLSDQVKLNAGDANDFTAKPPSLGQRRIQGGANGGHGPPQNRSCTPPPPQKKKKKRGKKRDKTKPHNFTPPPCAAKSCLYVQLLLKYANYNTLIGYMNVFIILLTIQHCHKICNGSLCS